MIVTPEEIVARFRQAQEAATRAQEEQMQELAKKRRQQLLTSGFGALAGLLVGYGVNRLLNNQQARAKIQASASRIGDQLIGTAEKQLEAVFNPELGASTTFRPFPEAEGQRVQDAEFEIVEDQDDG